MTRTRILCVCALLVVVGLGIWWWARRETSTATSSFGLRDVTALAGIEFRHESGARGEKLNPETFGPGAGWIDADGDGLIDLLLVNGNTLRGDPDPRATSRFYRNVGGGQFEDRTPESGLGIASYSMGFTSADYDEDGDADIFLYGYRRSYLLANDGKGTFRDVTSDSGLENLPGWICAAAFFDYDQDGWLDLYIGNYVDWRPELEEGVDCNFGTSEKRYCPVSMFPPSAPQLFRGGPEGRFQETTEQSGVGRLLGKSLGVVVEDYDQDGDLDLFVANDSVPNFLLENQGDGTFRDLGIVSGFATDADGAALAGMGIDSVWTENGSMLSIAIGNFSGEPVTLHVQDGVQYFVERSLSLGVGKTTLDSVTFGVALEDFDLDGHTDLAVANGHVFDVEELSRIPYRQPLQLFFGSSSGQFHELTPDAEARPRWAEPILGRGLSTADYDGDGDIDLLVTDNQSGVRLLRNETYSEGHEAPSLRVDLEARQGPRDAIGASVTLVSRIGETTRSRRRTRRSSGSYLSQSERVITFGLEPGETPVRVRIGWRGNAVETFEPLPQRGKVSLVEGEGRAVEERPGDARKVAPKEGTTVSSVAARRRGVEQLGAGQLESALTSFDEAIRLHANDYSAHRFRLITLRKLGRRVELESALASVAERFDATLLMSHFGLVLEQMGYTELARQIFLIAARKDPKRPDIQISIGAIAYDRGHYEEARIAYEKALALEPDSLMALDNLGKISAVEKDWDRAKSYLQRAITLRPGFASALSTLGGIHVLEGDLESAEKCLLEAGENATRDEVRLNVHGNLGGLYYKKGQWQSAAEQFRRVLELSPEDAQAKRALQAIARQLERGDG